MSLTGKTIGQLPQYTQDVTGSILFPIEYNGSSYSIAQNKLTSSISASYASTASFATSASYSATSSFANNFNVAGTLTAQTLVVQTITSSIEYSSGSNIFGSQITNTQTMTGSVNITGSLTLIGRGTINDLTGSLFGTASQALTASYLLGYNPGFPFTGSARITGSLAITGSTSIFSGSLTINTTQVAGTSITTNTGITSNNSGFTSNGSGTSTLFGRTLSIGGANPFVVNAYSGNTSWSGSIGLTGSLNIAASGSLTVTSGSLFVLGSTSLSGSLNVSGSVTFSSLGTGTVSATSGLLSTTSDMTLKIEDGYINNALEKVLKLTPRYFHWKEDSGLPTDIRQLGFYAQEVNSALGEEAANTPRNETDKWGIYDRGIVAFLTKAIQEQNQTIVSLQDRITELENKLT
jgi:hypothetical protein